MVVDVRGEEVVDGGLDAEVEEGGLGLRVSYCYFIVNRNFKVTGYQLP